MKKKFECKVLVDNDTDKYLQFDFADGLYVSLNLVPIHFFPTFMEEGKEMLLGILQDDGVIADINEVCPGGFRICDATVEVNHEAVASNDGGAVLAA